MTPIRHGVRSRVPTRLRRGGSLAWRVVDASGRPTGESGRREGAVPVWGLAAVLARPDGEFTIIHRPTARGRK